MKHKKISIIALSILSVLIALGLILLQNNAHYSLRNPCEQTPVAGPCKALIYKYYYDLDAQECKEFLWGGCGGQVPFQTMEECKLKCE